MKVLLVNTYDRGGAANSCKRLHLGLLSKKVDSKILLRLKENQLINTYQFLIENSLIKPTYKLRAIKKINRILSKIGLNKIPDKRDEQRKFLNERPSGLEMFSFPNSGIDITKSELYKEADLINLHWVANFLDFESFFKKNKKPLVWTLHDMNAFSGGEHYEEKYLGIDNSGYPLKRDISKKELLVSNANIAIKRKVISRVKNLTIVTPSKWLMEEAKKSEVFRGRDIHHIPYGIDQKVFAPKDKITSRNELKIPKEKKVVLFVADFLKNNRKGLKFLTLAFEQLDRKDVVVCAVGNHPGKFVNPNFMNLGSIKEEKELSVVFSAADVFVIPSLMDNLPNTVLEALMCGTPVIGFPVGGIPEMIDEGVNGMVTKEISVTSLSDTINIFLNSMEKFDRGTIRENAIQKYALQIQANNYISLFREILDKK